MKKPILYIFVFFFLHVTGLLHSQVVIKGSIKSDENNSLAYANIVLKTLQDSLVAYTVSDETGRYFIEVNAVGTYQLNASYVGYQPFAVPIYVLQLNQDTITYDILLEPTTLETVEVTAKRRAIVITNDSIVYNAASFTQLQDKSLTEVLARLPGVKVENGKIYVNNEPVDELLINGKKISDNQTALTQSIAPVIVKEIKFKKVKDEVFGENKNVLDITLEESINTNLFGKIDGGLSLHNNNILPDVFANAFSLKERFRIHLIQSYDQIGLQNISDENLKLFDEETFEQRYNLRGIGDINAFNEGRIKNINDVVNQRKNNGGFAALFKPHQQLEVGGTLYYGLNRQEQLIQKTVDYIGVERTTEEKETFLSDNRFLKAQIFSEYKKDSTRLAFKLFYKSQLNEAQINNNWLFPQVDTLVFDYDATQQSRYIIPALNFKHRKGKFALTMDAKAEYLENGELDGTLNISKSIDYPLLKDALGLFEQVYISQRQITSGLQMVNNAAITYYDSLYTFKLGVAHQHANNDFMLAAQDQEQQSIQNTFFENNHYHLRYNVYSPFVEIKYRRSKRFRINTAIKRHYYEWLENGFATKTFNEFNGDLTWQYGSMFRIFSLKYSYAPEIPMVMEIANEYRLVGWNQYAVGGNNLDVVPTSLLTAVIVHTLPKYAVTVIGVYINGTSKNTDSYNFIQSPFYSVRQENQLPSDYQIFQIEPSFPIGDLFSAKTGYYFQQNKIENFVQELGLFELFTKNNEVKFQIVSGFNQPVFNFNSSASFITERFISEQVGTNVASNFLRYELNPRFALLKKTITLDINWSKYLTIKGVENNLDIINMEIMWQPKSKNYTLGYVVNNLFNATQNSLYNYYEWGNAATGYALFGSYHRLVASVKLY